MTDEKILQGLKAQDQAVLQEMMNKYYRYIYTVVSNILGPSGSHEDAEELVQDTFYAVWNHAEDIRGKLKPYLCTTARNRAKSALRREREIPMWEDMIELPDPKGDLEEAAIQREMEQRVRRALSRMRPKVREVFLRYYYCLQNSEEIAEEMHIPSATVRSMLVRGRKSLAKTLGKEGSF